MEFVAFRVDYFFFIVIIDTTFRKDQSKASFGDLYPKYYILNTTICIYIWREFVGLGCWWDTSTRESQAFGSILFLCLCLSFTFFFQRNWYTAFFFFFVVYVVALIMWFDPPHKKGIWKRKKNCFLIFSGTQGLLCMVLRVLLHQVR